MKFRDFTEDDVEAAVDLGLEEWGKYSGYPVSAVRPFVVDVIKEYLQKTSYAKICEIDGKVAGLLFGRVDGEKTPVFDVIREPRSSFPEFGLREFDKERNANDKMLGDCKNLGYDSEVVYFISSKEHRKEGIGSMLFDGFLDYAKSKGCKRTYLFTDDFSNYGYYEKKGFVRDATTVIFIDGKDHEYYIYSKKH